VGERRPARDGRPTGVAVHSDTPTMTTATREPRPSHAPIVLERRAFDAIPRDGWEILLAATPHATPFSRWTFHRAWWDAYRDSAEDHYLVVTDPAATGMASGPLRAIVPLMIRLVPGEGRVLYMGASYHADYATILAAPADLPATAAALASTLLPVEDADLAWGLDAIDFRRLRRSEPTGAILASAFAAVAPGGSWLVERIVEDVCPILTLASDWESQLASMSRVARHELRRKLRRAERSGPVTLRHLPLEPSTVDRFIELHQARWGAAGLFPATADGERSRMFIHRLSELEAALGPAAQLLIVEVSVGDRVIAASVSFDDGTTCCFYNAGMDPAARDLSPGVISTAMLIRDRIGEGTRRFDFLRGDEAYKYEWGAVDEVIERVIVRRALTGAPVHRAPAPGQVRTTAQ
jgi:CelD/BcsL family acetyltransferase involved in cellulose biosynthesis